MKEHTPGVNRRELLKNGLSTMVGIIAVGHIGEAIVEGNEKDRKIAVFKETGKLYPDEITADTQYSIIAHGPESNNVALLHSLDGKLIITEIPELTRLPDGTEFKLEASDGSEKGYVVKVLFER